MNEPTRILVTEDEDEIRQLVAQHLRSLGHNALEASSAEEVLELFRPEPGQIPIILLDIKLPGLSGLDIVDELLEIDRNVVLIIFSAYLEEFHRVASRKGVFDFLPKGPKILTEVGRIVTQAQRYRTVLETCDHVESQQRDLERCLAKTLDIQEFMSEFLRLLQVPFADGVSIRLALSEPLAPLWDLAKESRPSMMDPEAEEAKAVLAPILSRPSIQCRSREGETRWVRELSEADFPIEEEVIWIPLAPSGQVLGALELTSSAGFAFRHHQILRRWRELCDVSGVRLLASLRAFQEQSQRIQSLKDIIHEMSRLSREFKPLIERIPDPGLRREFDTIRSELGAQINALRVKKNLITPDDNNWTIFDPNLVLYDIQQRYGGALDSVGGNWQLEVDEELVAIRVHEVKFRSAIENLVINAIEALAEDDGNDDRQIGLIARLDDGTTARIEVWDNGPGFPKSIEDPLSTPFSSKGPVGERGSGLSLVRDAVRHLGGKIRYQPYKPSGARFILTFPHHVQEV